MRVSKSVRFAPWLALMMTMAACDDDDDGQGPPVQLIDQTPPAAGTALTFSALTSTSLTVSWGAATDDKTGTAELAYRLVRATSASELDSVEKVDAIVGAQLLVDYGAGVLTRPVSGLQSATRYFFALVVRDQTGNKTIYPVANATTLDDNAPTVGAGISFSNTGSNTVTVSWGAASDSTTPPTELEYKLVKSLDPALIDSLEEVQAIETGADLLLPFSKGVTSADVTGLSTSTRYAFAVAVRDAQGNQALYTPATVSTTDVTPPAPGSAIEFSGVTATTLNVSWGAATDGVTEPAKLAYKLVRADDAAQIDTLEEADAVSGSALVADFTAGLSSANVTGLTSSTAYAFAVVVRDEANNRALYTPATGRTQDVSAPTAGSAIAFSAITATGLTLSWGEATDDVTPSAQLEYRVVWANNRSDIDTTDEIARITGSQLLQDYTAGLTSKAVTDLQSGSNYAFAVMVRDQAGNRTVYSPVSRATSDDTTPVVGAAIRFSAVDASSVTVSWGKATDNVTSRANLRYRLVKATSAAEIDTIAKVDAITGRDLLIDYGADVGLFSLSELASSSTFAFAVVVRDEAGNRALYAPATVSTLDISAPAVGAEITFANVTASAITLQWGAAADDISAPTALEYKAVIAATPSAIDTIPEVEAITAGPTLLLDYTANALGAQATGLRSSSSYAFAVLVRDQAGNRALYSPAVRGTLDVTAPTVGTAVNFAGVTDSTITVQWGAGSDDLTDAAELQYKVVGGLQASELDTLEKVDAITSGPQLVQDFTSNLGSVQVTGLDSSTSYAFAVVLRDEAGNRSLYTPQVVSTLDVSAPTPGLALGFADVTASGMTVSWGAASDDITSAGDLTYKLVTASASSAIDTLAEVDAITTGPGLVFDYTANVLSYAASGLTSSTSYAYAVVVRDAAGNRALYAPGTQATIDVTAPSVGTTIVASSVTSSSMQLSWGVATDDLTPQSELSYRVVQAADAAAIDTLAEATAISGSGIVQNYTAALTQLSVSGLSGGTSYAFAVLVRDGTGNVALYAPITQATQDVVAPTVGTAVVFSNLTSTSVTVSWGAASDDVTAGAQLQYKLVRAATAAEIDTIAEADAITSAPALVADYTTNLTSSSAGGLTALTSYAFAVLVRDAAGNRALYTPQVTTTPDGQAPTLGTDIAFSSVTSTSYTISWGAASDNVTPQANLEYRLVRGASAAELDSVAEVNAITGGNLLVDWTANTLSFAATGLNAGNFYHYAVAVRDSSQNTALYASNSRVNGPIFYVSTTKISSNLGGPSGADAFCGSARDRRASTNGAVKAMLAAGNSRRACSTANCTSAAENVDWVLHANTAYYNTSGDNLGTTNGAGIYTFPVSAAFAPGSTAYTHSGFNNNWTSNSGNCSEFSDDASTGVLYLGRPAQSSVSAIWYANTLCSYSVSVVPIYVLCVEQ
jgi:hypothetical protein